MKKQTKKLFILMGILLGFSWISFMLIIVGPVRVRVSAFSASEDGTIIICQRDRLLLVSSNEAVETVSCPIESPFHVEAAGNIITVSGYGYYREYDLSSKMFGSIMELEEPLQQQDLRKPVLAGDSEYSYKRSFGRYRFYETKPDGEMVLRYEMPLFDYVVMLCAITFGVPLFASIPFAIVHIFRNYKWTDRGMILWNEWKR